MAGVGGDRLPDQQEERRRQTVVAVADLVSCEPFGAKLRAAIHYDSSWTPVTNMCTDWPWKLSLSQPTPRAK
jgi:hypothetical protein